jgi:hypothetical protein
MSHVEGYADGYIEDVVRRSSTTKARLLHYFPPGDDEETSQSDDNMDTWCGEHVDHSTLTGTIESYVPLITRLDSGHVCG